MAIKWRSFMRTKENGGRRSRTLMSDDRDAQVQGKEALVSDNERYIQLRVWTGEVDAWTHIVFDPNSQGLDAIAAVGTGRTEPESWDMARAAFKASRGIDL